MDAEIALVAVQLEENKIGFSATINYNNQVKNLTASGTLFNSYKQKKGVNSTVGELTDASNNFDVLLFEVYNADIKDRAITDAKFENKPHLNLYLADHEGNVLLFEINIPESLKNIKINNDEKPNTTNDGFWFTKVIKPYKIGEIPVDDEMLQLTKSANFSTLAVGGISPSAVGSFSDWTNSTSYYASFYVGSTFYECTSLAYGSWKALNVTNQSTWVNSFKIAENTKVNGVVDRTLDNAFRYRNIKLSTGVGAKSTIVNAISDGRLVGSPSSPTMFVAEKLWSTLLPAAPSISDIRGWISVLGSGTSKTVTLGSSNIKLSASPTVVQRVGSGNYELLKWTDITGASTGHYLVLQTTVQYESTSGTSATANGIMNISWDVYYSSLLYNSGSNELTFSYTVSP